MYTLFKRYTYYKSINAPVREKLKSEFDQKGISKLFHSADTNYLAINHKDVLILVQV